MRFQPGDADLLREIAQASDDDESAVHDYYGGQFVRLWDADALRRIANEIDLACRVVAGESVKEGVQ